MEKKIIINTRKDLANLIDISLQDMNEIVYGKRRSSYYTAFKIKKSSGKLRKLHSVNGRLKELQKIALKALQNTELFKPSQYSQGFTIGKSIITNASYHSRMKLIIKFDLLDFFPSINFRRVVGMFMAPPFNFGKEAAVTMGHIACLDDGNGTLPQGGVLSPYIANMLCRRLDKRLAKTGLEHKCKFTRYADDLTFSTNNINKFEKENFKEKIYEIIESENFRANKKKTKILYAKDRQIVTGIVVNDGLNVNKKYIKSVRSILHKLESGKKRDDLEKDKFDDKRSSRCNHKDMQSFLEHLYGRINFIGSVVTANEQDDIYNKDQSKYKRIKTYENFLDRFLNLDALNDYHEDLKKIVDKAVSKRSRLVQISSLENRWDREKQKHLNDFNKKEHIGSKLNKIDKIENMAEIELIIKNLRKKDPRFHKKLGHDLEEIKNKIKGTISYPMFSISKTSYLLESLKSNDSLKYIVHSKKRHGLTIEDHFESLIQNYLPIYYFLPFSIREEFDLWIDQLERVAAEFGYEKLLDTVKDIKISKHTEKLKKNLRFSINPSTGASLYSLIESIIENQESSIPISNKTENINLYTHVPSVKNIISYIVESMVAHSHNNGASQINISHAKNIDGFIEILISDNAKKTQLNQVEDNSFLHGKLIDALKAANGICHHWIELTLADGNRICLDAQSSELLDNTLLAEKSGFTHRLRFPKII